MALPQLVSLTKEQQLIALKMLVPDYALGERKPGVAGGKDWVPHEWVTYALDTIFGPDHWSVRIGALNPMTAPDGEMYIYIPVELTVTFADGQQCTRADVGVGFVRFTKEAKQRNAEDLSDTPLDNFSTGYKSAVTSGIKGCCRDLGRIFIPMQSEKIMQAIRMETLERELTRAFLPAPEEPQKLLDQNKKALGRDNGDLTTTPKVESPKPLQEPVAKCAIKTSAWSGMLVKLHEKTAYFNGKDGAINGYHATNAAARCGYSEVTDDNIQYVFNDLVQYALEQTIEAPVQAHS